MNLKSQFLKQILLNEKYSLTKEQITQNYNFTPRQADYYFNAGKYLGLLQRKKEGGKTIFCLTPDGSNLFNLSIFNRQIRFTELILSHSMFSNTLSVYFKNGIKPAKKDIIQIMRDSNLGKITSDKTYDRRASTVVSWIDWIINLAQE
jgi:predicted transcriptional regulator